jgi:hypothetical protein
MDSEPPEQNVVREEAAEVAFPPKEETENPWVKYAGMLRDHPNFDEWRAAVEEYRREKDRWEREKEEEELAEQRQQQLGL